MEKKKMKNEGQYEGGDGGGREMARVSRRVSIWGLIGRGKWSRSLRGAPVTNDGIWLTVYLPDSNLFNHSI
jgi:hypothetical protein